MTKKNWLLLIFLCALGAAYVIWFTDWFRPKPIHIFHTVREIHYFRRPGEPERSLIFGVDPRDIRLTEVKVVPLLNFEKDPHTLPVFRGMRPFVAGAEPGLLDTNLDYRIFIRAGHATGVHDFKIGDSPADTADTTVGGNP
jgi:hypothetical protein